MRGPTGIVDVGMVPIGNKWGDALAEGRKREEDAT